MKLIEITKSLIACAVIIHLASLSYAENIDPYDDGSQYAYGENVGWLNFEPSEGPGVAVSQTQLTGYVWAENIGWINLSPSTYGGVLNDGSGNLSGYAWGENIGWINFSPTYGSVTIDPDGNFDVWAWGENIGWINLQSADLYGYNVMACKVKLEDLANFVNDWPDSGAGIPGDLSGNEEVNFVDYSIFADF